METYFDILRAVASGVQKPTRIMYKANLSWTIMQGYLEKLLAQGLIAEESEEEKRIYRLTQRGFHLLQQFHSVQDDLNLSTEPH